MFGWLGNLGKLTKKEKAARKAARKTEQARLKAVRASFAKSEAQSHEWPGWQPRPAPLPEGYGLDYYRITGKTPPAPEVTQKYTHWENVPGAGRPWSKLTKKARARVVAAARQAKTAAKSTAVVAGRKVTLGRPRSKTGKALGLHCGCKIVNTKGGSGKAVVCPETGKVRRFLSKVDAAKAKNKTNICAYMPKFRPFTKGDPRLKAMAAARKRNKGYTFKTSHGVPMTLGRKPTYGTARKMTAYYYKIMRERAKKLGRKLRFQPSFAGYR